MSTILSLVFLEDSDRHVVSFAFSGPAFLSAFIP
jgi:hypothetical protein